MSKYFLDEEFAELSTKRHNLFNEVFSKVCELYGSTDYWNSQLDVQTSIDVKNLIYEIMNLKCHIAYHFMQNGANHDFIMLEGALTHLIITYNNILKKKSLNRLFYFSDSLMRRYYYE